MHLKLKLYLGLNYYIGLMKLKVRYNKEYQLIDNSIEVAVIKPNGTYLIFNFI